MIYDEIKSWVKHVTKWSAVPGYISYSLNKQTFKDDPLFPYFLHMAVHVEANDKLSKWFLTKYAQVLETFDFKYFAAFYQSYKILADNGYLFDQERNMIHTQVWSLGRICLPEKPSKLSNLIYPFVFEYEDSLFFTDIAYVLSYAERLTNTIDFNRCQIDSAMCNTKPIKVTVNTIVELLSGVVDEASAQQVLALFKTHKFSSSFLQTALSYNPSNEWFATVLQKTVEEVLSEIFAYQLAIPMAKVAALVNLLGTEDVYHLVNTLIQQRDLVFDKSSTIEDLTF